MGNNKGRDANLELIRIIAMIFVMCIHTVRKPFELGTVQDGILSAIIYLCNGWFYMLSGQLNLNKRFENAIDIKKFYISRFITIGLPFIFISMMLTLYEYITSTGNFSCIMWLKWCYSAILDTNVSGHMWFLYPLVGFLLCTPVLAIAFRQMTDEELTIVFVIGVAWNVFQAYLCADVGVGFSFSGWMLSGWALAYFAGYYIWRVINKQNFSKLFWLGIVGVGVTIFARCRLYGKFYGTFDVSVAYVFYAMASYYLMSKCVHVKNEKVGTIICYIARYSFMMYLVHDFINYNIVDKYLNINSDGLYFLVAVALMFAISFAVAWTIDTLIVFPMTKCLRKLLKV